MRKSLTLLTCLIFLLKTMAQDAQKKGYNLGALPAISFNSDEGLQYGAIANLFNYGDGINYPEYKQSYYLEFSKYTKGSTVGRFYFDSEHIIPGIRTFADVSYITEDMLDFYGYNGYKSDYSLQRADNNRAFYKMSQKQIRLLVDFKGKLPITNLFWVASFNMANYALRSVDYTKLNTNNDYPDLTPGQSLYEKYINWGIIRPNESNGGLVNALKAGIVFDSRKVLNNPSSGIYTEALIEIAPRFINETAYARYSLLHRQYQTIVKNRLNLAIRIGIQGKIGNNIIPFYRNTVLMSPFATRTSPNGLGGASSIRGMLRNRVVGDAFALGNFELRWKVVPFRLINQNFYLGVNAFLDEGYILDPFNWNLNNLSESDKSEYFNLEESDGLHSTIGSGVKLVMNQNFIVSCELGKTLNKKDGDSGMYINLNYLF
jgi:hypothetical protein